MLQMFLSKKNQPINPFSYDMPCTSTKLTSFNSVTPTEVAKLIQTLTFKFSPADKFPSSLIKSHSQSFSIIIANLANLSFLQGKFPSQYKIAQITPILKNSNLI